MSQTDSQPMKRAKVSLPERVDDEIEARLEYGDSKSAWIREACQMRLNGQFDGESAKNE